MNNRREYISLPARPCFFHSIQTIILDVHIIISIFSELYSGLPIWRCSIKEKHKIDAFEQRLKNPKSSGKNLRIIRLLKKLNKKDEQFEGVSPITQIMAASQEKQQLLEIYSKDVLLGIVTFVIFATAGVMMFIISGGIEKFEVLIKIIGWFISVGGVICVIRLVARDEYEFIKLLLTKGSSKQTSDQRVAVERRTI